MLTSNREVIKKMPIIRTAFILFNNMFITKNTFLLSSKMSAKSEWDEKTKCVRTMLELKSYLNEILSLTGFWGFGVLGFWGMSRCTASQI